MSQITILLLYLLAAAAFTMSRLPRFDARSRPLFLVACILAATGIVIHGEALFHLVLPKYGFDLTLGNAASLIGLELAIMHLVLAAFFALTIIGIPIAAQHIKLIPLALLPFGRQMIDIETGRTYP